MRHRAISAALGLTCFVALLAPGCRHATNPGTGHPDLTEPGWMPLFAPDLSNARNPGSVWHYDNGILTADADEVLWSDRPYGDFILDLEFRTAPGTNSGVIIRTDSIDAWVPNSIEIQIADDYHEEWAQAPATWHCGAVFGHAPPTKRMVREPGAWNRYTITAIGPRVWIVLNGEQVNAVDLRRWTSAEMNPDGSEIPEWLSKPLADLPYRGHIGLQGKHADAPIWFRNLRIKTLP